MSRRQKSSPSTESMNASGVLGCDIPFQIRQADLAIGENCNQDILFIFRIIREQDFSSPPQTPILGLGELAIFPLANKETNKCPGVYPSGFFIRVRSQTGCFARIRFVLAFPSPVFLSRALAEERSPLLLLLPAGEKSPVAHYCLVVP